MRYYELTSEELKILKDVEQGQYRRVKNFHKQKKEYQKAATIFLNKTKNVNIRLTEKDLLGYKAKAVTEGVP